MRRGNRRRGEDALLFLHRQRQVGGDIIGQPPRILGALYAHRHIRRQLRGQRGVGFKICTALAHERLLLKRVGNPPLQAFPRNHPEIRLRFDRRLMARPVQPFHQDPQVVAGQLEHLAHLGHHADLIQRFHRRVVAGDILLRHQINQLVRVHRVVERLNGFAAADVKMQQHAGKNDQAAQRQQRQRLFSGHTFLYTHGDNHSFLQRKEG